MSILELNPSIPKSLLNGLLLDEDRSLVHAKDASPSHQRLGDRHVGCRCQHDCPLDLISHFYNQAQTIALAEDVVAASLDCMVNSTSKSGCGCPTTKFQQYSRHFLYSHPAQPMGPKDLVWRMVGFNGGVPISEEFFVQNISGKHNEELSRLLLPDWDLQRAMNFMDDKEALFQRLAYKELKPLNGLNKLCNWIEDRGLKRVAVTNAPKSNAELLITMLGLTDFFETVVLAEECERAKPYPVPYLKGLEALKV